VYNNFILILFLEGVIMNEKRVDDLEKRIVALEKIVQEQQKNIEKLISINSSKDIKINHPSLNNGTMLC